MVQRAKFQAVANKKREALKKKGEYTLVSVYAGVFDTIMSRIEVNQQARAQGLMYDKKWQYKKLEETLPRE